MAWGTLLLSKQAVATLIAPKTPIEDKLSEAITLKFTPKEKELILLKAGDIPLATFIKNYIKRNTNLI